MSSNVVTAVAQRVTRSIEFRVDRASIPKRNDWLDARFRRHASRYLQEIDEAVDRATAWLSPQADVSMSVLYVARQTLELIGDQRFGFVDEKAEHYRRTIRDAALRMVLPDYDPDDPEHRALPDVADVRPYVPIELLMIDCAWADVRKQPDILDRLAAFEDDGKYGSTHIIVGGQILLRNRGAPASATRALMNRSVPPIARANNFTSVAGDIFAERIMVLQWLGLDSYLRPAWILRLLRAQRADGGWSARNMPPLGQSNQHTTILAMAVLAVFLARMRANVDGAS